MEIVNVFEIKQGVAGTIQSFPIIDDKYRKPQIEAAEKLFLELAKKNGYDEDGEDILDDGNWDNENGYEVIISWSEINL